MTRSPPELGIATLLACAALATGVRAQLVAPPDAGPREAAQPLLDRFEGWLDIERIEVDGVRCVIRAADDRLVEVVAATAEDDPVVVTPVGRVLVDGWLLTRSPIDDVLALVEGLDVIGAGATARSPLDHAAEVRFDPLTGMALRLPAGDVVTPDGRFSATSESEVVTGLLAERLDVARSEIQRLTQTTSALDQTSWLTLVDVLQRATVTTADELDPSVDDLMPASVRRMIRHGWLAEALPDTPRARAVERAVVLASRPEAVETWTRDGEVIRIVRDAFGRESRARTTATGATVATRAPLACYGELDWDFPDDGWIVLELAAGTDPLGPLEIADVRSARFLESATTIASWTPDGGLEFDPEVWRAEVPIEALIDYQHATNDYLPPHVALVDVRGDVLGLATAHGLLEPARAGEPADVERFLSDAARMLPDPAHLDLIGQYLIDYAYDGPDRTHPEIPGTVDYQGDRHQTVAETLGSVRGGVCVGDCDDVAEVYVELWRRQGRHALALGVPGHMFAAAAEQTEDGWFAHVLQTGLAESHPGEDLAAAVECALSAQDASIEPDALTIEAWLRIDAGPLRLSTWIDANALADPSRVAHVREHARLESRGLWATTRNDRRDDLDRDRPASMARDGGSLDVAARHARLAEAAVRVGDFAAAREHATHAAAPPTGPGPRVHQMTTALMAAIALDDDRAVRDDQLALRIAVADLRAASDRVSVLYQTARAVDRLLEAADGGHLAARLAAELLPLGIAQARQRLDGDSDAAFAGSDEMAVADGLQFAAESCARAVRVIRHEQGRAALRRALDDWLAVARERDELGTWSEHGAMVGTMRRTDSESFVARLSRTRPSVEFPEDLDDGAWPWIAGDCTSWQWELLDLLAPGRTTPDDRTVRRLLNGLNRSIFLRQSAGAFEESDFDTQIWSKLVEGLLLDRAGSIGAALRVAELQAPDMLPGYGVELTKLARHVPPERYARAIELWLRTEGRHRDAFSIVWATRVHVGHDRALSIADAVCERFPEDTEFARERELLAAMR